MIFDDFLLVVMVTDISDVANIL